MATLFANMKTDGIEDGGDRLGGFGAIEANVYTGPLKAFYAGKSSGGASSLTVVVGLDGGKEFSETVYITNRAGENFYLDKTDKTKKHMLPGFKTINDIVLCTLGKPLEELQFEDKVINVYDHDAGKEMPKSVPMAVEILGQSITLAIKKTIEDKTKKDGNGEYQPTGDTKEVNNIDKVFDTDSKLTVSEAMNGEKTSAFHDAWIERNKGKVNDKSSKNDNTRSGGVAGRPGGSNAGPPQAGAGAGAPARKSLFGAK